MLEQIILQEFKATVLLTSNTAKMVTLHCTTLAKVGHSLIEPVVDNKMEGLGDLNSTNGGGLGEKEFHGFLEEKWLDKHGSQRESYKRI